MEVKTYDQKYYVETTVTPDKAVTRVVSASGLNYGQTVDMIVQKPKKGHKFDTGGKEKVVKSEMVTVPQKVIIKTDKDTGKEVYEKMGTKERVLAHTATILSYPAGYEYIGSLLSGRESPKQVVYKRIGQAAREDSSLKTRLKHAVLNPIVQTELLWVTGAVGGAVAGTARFGGLAARLASSRAAGIGMRAITAGYVGYEGYRVGSLYMKGEKEKAIGEAVTTAVGLAGAGVAYKAARSYYSPKVSVSAQKAQLTYRNNKFHYQAEIREKLVGRGIRGGLKEREIAYSAEVHSGKLGEKTIAGEKFGTAKGRMIVTQENTGATKIHDFDTVVSKHASVEIQTGEKTIGARTLTTTKGASTEKVFSRTKEFYPETGEGIKQRITDIGKKFGKVIVRSGSKEMQYETGVFEKVETGKLGFSGYEQVSLKTKKGVSGVVELKDVSVSDVNKVPKTKIENVVRKIEQKTTKKGMKPLYTEPETSEVTEEVTASTSEKLALLQKKKLDSTIAQRLHSTAVDTNVALTRQAVSTVEQVRQIPKEKDIVALASTPTTDVVERQQAIEIPKVSLKPETKIKEKLIEEQKPKEKIIPRTEEIVEVKLEQTQRIRSRVIITTDQKPVTEITTEQKQVTIAEQPTVTEPPIPAPKIELKPPVVPFKLPKPKSGRLKIFQLKRKPLGWEVQAKIGKKTVSFKDIFATKKEARAYALRKKLLMFKVSPIAKAPTKKITHKVSKAELRQLGGWKVVKRGKKKKKKGSEPIRSIW